MPVCVHSLFNDLEVLFYIINLGKMILDDSNEGDRFYLTLIYKILQTILVGLQDMDFFFPPVCTDNQWLSVSNGW